MDLTLAPLKDVDVTGDIKLAVQGDALGLYMAQTSVVEPKSAPFYDFQTTLTSIALDGSTALTPALLTIPQPLPGMPSFDLVFTSDGAGELTYCQFGGGWNILTVDGFKDEALSSLYDYQVEESNKPHFLINTSDSAAKQQFVSATFSGYQLGIIGLQEQDGQQVPHVSGIVGSSDSPVSGGRVFGDLSSGLPVTVSVIYKQDKDEGPLAPNGAFCGTLSFAPYDINADKLGTPVDLLSGTAVADYDLAVAAGTYGLLASTGDGSPMLALFDDKGALIGTPNLPLGSWNGADRWIVSPTIAPTPGGKGGFSFAFVEMSEAGPVGLYTGTLAPPPAPTP